MRGLVVVYISKMQRSMKWPVTLSKSLQTIDDTGLSIERLSTDTKIQQVVQSTRALIYAFMFPLRQSEISLLPVKDSNPDMHTDTDGCI
jgi:hypothetical protein